METERISQLSLLRDSEIECLRLINETQPPEDGVFCPPTWDGAYCWPFTTAGRTVEAACPHYVHGFDPGATARKLCTDNGTWWQHPELNSSWTNYSLCEDTALFEDSPFTVHIPVIKMISQAGYAVSLTLLAIACLLLGSVRKLRCSRNNLHLQLFLSFILRASLSLLRDAIYKERLEQTVMCKAMTAVWQYCLMANYSWILMEGFYLHNLVFVSMFTDTAGIFKYGLLGWSLPLFFLIPWAVMKAMFEDNLCWTLNENQNIFWIIRGPITASIILNLFFFINISRVLFLKMFSSRAIQSRRYRYRKWFKSTLVLVPLFGVHYSILLAVNLASIQSQTLEIIWLYVDQTFSAFQGSFVAVLYCFLNGEVKSEVRKLYREKNDPQPVQNSLLTQSLTYISKGRSSIQSLHVLPERKDHWKNGEMQIASVKNKTKRSEYDATKRIVADSVL